MLCFYIYYLRYVYVYYLQRNVLYFVIYHISECQMVSQTIVLGNCHCRFHKKALPPFSTTEHSPTVKRCVLNKNQPILIGDSSHKRYWLTIWHCEVYPVDLPHFCSCICNILCFIYCMKNIFANIICLFVMYKQR